MQKLQSELECPPGNNNVNYQYLQPVLRLVKDIPKTISNTNTCTLHDLTNEY